MKNNRGFTLIGLMIIAGILAVITVTGMSVFKHLSDRSKQEERTSESNQLKANIQNSLVGATSEGSGSMQVSSQQDIPTTQNPDDPTSALNPNNPNNPNNPDSVLNPNHPQNQNNPFNPLYIPPSTTLNNNASQ